MKTPYPDELRQQQERERLKKLEQEIKLREERLRLREGLPHLFGFKEYPWSRKFIESRNRMLLLTSANQVGKTSAMIRKVILWATEKELWPEVFTERTPRVFWWLTSNQDHINEEFHTKWVPDFLPRGEFKNDPKYGWELITGKNGNVSGIKFNSGVTLFFKFYTQKVDNLQGRSVDLCACDEELPEHFFDEIWNRLSATRGYFMMVFTATLGQDIWRRTMEPRTPEEEKFPQAEKIQVSLYDCQTFEDGTPSRWTPARIAERVAACRDHNEYLKRIMGRFVMTTGLRVPAFSIKDHMKPPHPLPTSWSVYAGVDPGSGGEKGHPAAIVFVAVSPDFRQGRVIAAWRGDGILTTSGDIVEKFIEIKRDRQLFPVLQCYDFADKDFETIATRMNEPFVKADKDRDRGFQTLNTLFKYNMLALYSGDPEIMKLANEFSTLREDAKKQKAQDDLVDACRYVCAMIPWDFSIINQQTAEEPPHAEEEIAEDPATRRALERRARARGPQEAKAHTIEDEFEFWDDLMSS